MSVYAECSLCLCCTASASVVVHVSLDFHPASEGCAACGRSWTRDGARVDHASPSLEKTDSHAQSAGADDAVLAGRRVRGLDIGYVHTSQHISHTHNCKTGTRTVIKSYMQLLCI